MIITMLAALVTGRHVGLSEVLARASSVALETDMDDHAGEVEQARDLDPLDHLKGFEVRDLRQTRARDRPARGRAVGYRAARSIKALCWHQTAAAGLGPYHPRILGLPAHALVGRRGGVVLLHPVTSYVYHGHAANAWSIGIEVQARAAGLEGEARTFWRSRREKTQGPRHRSFEQLVAEATDRQLLACLALARYYAAVMVLHQHPLRAWVTHRQTARKPSDPGQRIALMAALAGRELELPEDWTTKTWGKGRPQPDQWVGVDRGVSYR